MNKKGIINNLAAVALVLAACDAHEPNAPNPTQAKAVITATIEANTRALDSNTGYNNEVKEIFVEGDVINIDYQVGKIDRAISACCDANGKWITSDEFSFEPTITKTITATYTKDDDNGYHDNLEATATLTAPASEGDPYTVNFNFEHSRALVELKIYINGKPATSKEVSNSNMNFTTAEGKSKSIAYSPQTDSRHILPVKATITSVEVKMVDQPTIVATPESNIVTEKGKTYTIIIKTLKEGATFSVEQNQIPAWGASTNARLENTATLHYIYDEQDLIDFRNAVNGNGENTPNPTLNAIQMANITLTGDDWEPIGNKTNTYKGTYNGNAYTIAKLKITGEYENAGLFGHITDGTLANIHLVDVEVDPTKNTASGALAGSFDGTIALCSSSGTVKGGNAPTQTYVGGLVGYSNGHITRSYSACTVAGYSMAGVGGLVGWNSALIVASAASGNVSSSGNSGGMIGTNNGSCYYSYATGKPTGGSYVSGFAGSSNNTYCCYTMQSTFANSRIAEDPSDSNWCAGNEGTPSDRVRKDRLKKVVRTWIDGEVKNVIFGPEVWKAGNYPTIDFNNTGELQP